jgi:hypothetical protein
MIRQEPRAQFPEPDSIDSGLDYWFSKSPQGRSKTLAMEKIIQSLSTFNPLIVLAVGVLVGVLSSDRPALTSVVGLTPWVLMLRGPAEGDRFPA